MARLLRSLRQVATLRHGHMARRSASLRSCIQGTRGMWTYLTTGERKWVKRNGSNRPPVPWVESSPFRNWVEWTWVDLEKCQVQGRQHIDFDPSPFDPTRPQSIRPKLFDQKGRPNSFRPISFDPFHAILWLRYKNFETSCFDPIQKFGMSTWELTLIFDPVPSTYFCPPRIFISGISGVNWTSFLQDPESSTA